MHSPLSRGAGERWVPDNPRLSVLIFVSQRRSRHCPNPATALGWAVGAMEAELVGSVRRSRNGLHGLGRARADHVRGAMPMRRSGVPARSAASIAARSGRGHREHRRPLTAAPPSPLPRPHRSSPARAAPPPRGPSARPAARAAGRRVSESWYNPRYGFLMGQRHGLALAGEGRADRRPARR